MDLILWKTTELAVLCKTISRNASGLTIDCPNRSATYEVWVLPVHGLQLLAHLEVVLLRRRRLRLEALGRGERGPIKGLHQELGPGRGVQGEADLSVKR